MPKVPKLGLDLGLQASRSSQGTGDREVGRAWAKEEPRFSPPNTRSLLPHCLSANLQQAQDVNSHLPESRQPAAICPLEGCPGALLFPPTSPMG